MSGDWYETHNIRDPKADFVFDLATGVGMWDPGPGSGFYPVKMGYCDLAWYPGWMLRHGWPNVGLTTWPKNRTTLITTLESLT